MFINCSQWISVWNPMESGEGWAKMLSHAFKRWLSFQFFPPKFFNHLIAQIYHLLSALPTPQIPEIFGLLSGLDFGALYLRRHGHNIYSKMIVPLWAQESVLPKKKKSFQSVHRSFSKYTSFWQQCNTKMTRRIQFHFLDSGGTATMQLWDCASKWAQWRVLNSLNR